jgi:hypothetical protein
MIQQPKKFFFKVGNHHWTWNISGNHHHWTTILENSVSIFPAACYKLWIKWVLSSPGTSPGNGSLNGLGTSIGQLMCLKLLEKAMQMFSKNRIDSTFSRLVSEKIKRGWMLKINLNIQHSTFNSLVSEKIKRTPRIFSWSIGFFFPAVPVRFRTIPVKHGYKVHPPKRKLNRWT